MKTVIFDLDGTLVNSRKNIAEAVNFVRIVRGLEPLDDDAIIEKVNALTFNSAKNFYGEGACEKDHEIFEKKYGELCLNGLKLYSGISELLAELYKQKIKMAIATNASSVFARKMMDFAGVVKYFGAILGADLVDNPKPAPDMLFAALDKLGSNANESCFLGDSGKDMAAAKSAGVTGIFASWGYGVENKEAKYTIDKPQKLLKLI